jgi:hypothetical protein
MATLIIHRLGNTGTYSPVLPVSSPSTAPINQSLGRSIAEVPIAAPNKSTIASTPISSTPLTKKFGE